MVLVSGTSFLVAKLPLPEIKMSDENSPKQMQSLLLVLLLQLVTDDEVK